MKWLEQIDWVMDDGVNLQMINDYARNRFYENILSRYVRNQKCTDVGFGTGLLSIIALKHGAEHIRAFESDPNRYLLACEIVERLGLKNKIEVINERFQNNIKQTPITFSETVSSNMWGEGLYKNLPSLNSLPENRTLFLPSEYITEIHTLVISKNYTHGLINTFDNWYNYENDFFAPGIDIDDDFINLIAKFSNTKVLPTNTWPNDTIIKFPHQKNTIWGEKSYLNAIEYGVVSASFTVTNYIDDLKEIVFNIDTKQWQNSNVLIVPRYCLKHESDKLYIDKHSWGEAEYPIILVNPTKNLRITQSLNNNDVIYELVD
jgi:Ribosomal protein L11 methyltransferase (PrmA)